MGDDDQQTPFCNNANCAVRATVWSDLPYDETLTGLEDLDWAKRALAAGWKIVYQADARIAHVHNEPFGKTRNRYRREAIAHRRIFHDQHIGLVEAFGLFAWSTGRDYAAAAARRRLVSNLVGIPKFRAAQYLGTWEGFRDRDEISTSLRRRFYYPKGFTTVDRPSRGGRDEPLRRGVGADAPQQRAGAGQELPPVQRHPAVPAHRVDAARGRPDQPGRHRHRQPDRARAGGAGSRRCW